MGKLAVQNLCWCCFTEEAFGSSLVVKGQHPVNCSFFHSSQQCGPPNCRGVGDGGPFALRQSFSTLTSYFTDAYLGLCWE